MNFMYFIFNIGSKSIVSFQFHPWVKIVKGKVVSYEPEKDGGCWCGCGSVWYVDVAVNGESFSSI